VSWQVLRWIPGNVERVGDLLLLPIDGIALYAALRAMRRCASAVRLRSFWGLLALALTAELIGDLFQAGYDLTGSGKTPFPSLADPFYLAFYPLLLLALLRIPTAPVTRAKLIRTVLDGATIVVGGGAIVWYYVLGPTTLEGDQSAWAMTVSTAFPMGDLFLLAGLAAVILRPSPLTLRIPLRLIAPAVVLGVVADVLYGSGQLHGTYTPGDYIDTIYVLEFACFALAGAAQVQPGHADATSFMDDPAGSRSRASWLPYLSVAVGLGVILGVEREDRFFPNVSLVLIVIVLTLLVAVRQYLAQRELVNAQLALQESERAKDELLSVVGHELRTPMTSIRGSLGLLGGGVMGELPEDAANMVDIAIQSTDRLVRLINDILDMERMNAGQLELKLEPVEASELVALSLQALQSTADAGGVDFSSDVPALAVLADSDRVVQTLVNLLGNAVKFSAPGATVEIAVASAAPNAIFSVRDHGRGIPADRLQSIFDRYGQVDPSDSREGGGTGLGLPIARAIVNQHGGSMWVESEVGQGSTFSFTLPLTEVAVRRFEGSLR
jgi:signal transduction histidine kinase